MYNIYIYIPSEIIWVGFWIWQMLKSLMGVQFNERFWTFKCARSHEHHIYEEYSWLCISMWYHVSDIWNKCVLHSFTIVSPLDFASAGITFCRLLWIFTKKQKTAPRPRLGVDAVTGIPAVKTKNAWIVLQRPQCTSGPTIFPWLILCMYLYVAFYL